jgi:ribosomal protein L37AE/L43A
MNCPLCNSNQFGRIGRNHYYCHQCCHEWSKNSNQIKLFRIFEDGTMEPLKIKPKQAST